MRSVSAPSSSAASTDSATPTSSVSQGDSPVCVARKAAV